MNEAERANDGSLFEVGTRLFASRIRWLLIPGAFQRDVLRAVQCIVWRRGRHRQLVLRVECGRVRRRRPEKIEQFASGPNPDAVGLHFEAVSCMLPTAMGISV